jgi:hypothetical protein
MASTTDASLAPFCFCSIKAMNNIADDAAIAVGFTARTRCCLHSSVGHGGRQSQLPRIVLSPPLSPYSNQLRIAQSTSTAFAGVWVCYLVPDWGELSPIRGASRPSMSIASGRRTNRCSNRCIVNVSSTTVSPVVKSDQVPPPGRILQISQVFTLAPTYDLVLGPIQNAPANVVLPEGRAPIVGGAHFGLSPFSIPRTR